MARPAARRDADLALHGGVGPHDRARVAGGPQVGRVRGEDAFEHLVHEPLRVVEDLAHSGGPSSIRAGRQRQS